MMKTLIVCSLMAAAGAAWAQATPVGLWKTIDDDGKTEKSLVRIVESGGVLSGKIEKIMDASKQGEVCQDCTDERKDKPVLGMTIIRNVKAASAGQETWDGGDILDPNNGKVYRLRLKPLDAGKKLEVRGYIGMPLLGRSQTWVRVE